MFRIALKTLRENKEISQYQLAQDLGIAQSTIGMWESGKREPNYETTLKIATYFGVSVDYLLGNEKKENPTTNQSDEVLRLLQDPTMKLIYEKLNKLSESQIDEVIKYADYLRSKQENQ